MAPGRAGHGGRVDAGRRQHPAPAAGPALFLVELRAGGDGQAAAAALRLAVTRLQAAGTPIRWCGGWLVVGDRRCLCLVEAADGDAVVLARDTASLGAACVRLVQPLPDRPSPAPHPTTEGRS